MNTETAVVIVGATVAYQLWVSRLVVLAEMYESKQKWRQIAVIWVIPIVGAVVVHAVLRTEGKPPYKPEKEWTEPGDNAS
jgi:hypothetical protein